MDSAVEVRTGRADRRRAILDAAKLVFFEEGYPTASMDRIAERAGVTKKTVYAHFPGKQALFGAVVERACANVVAEIPQADHRADAPRAGLTRMLQGTRALMESPNCIALQRIVAGEAPRHPAFAATLSAAFAQGEALLAATLAGWVAAGQLKPHDVKAAARMLNDLTGYAVTLRGMLGEAADPSAIDQAVAVYLAAYGVG